MEPIGLDAAREQALVVKRLYDDYNQLKRGRTWTNEEFMLGFVGDIGDLAKLVMAREGAAKCPVASTLSATNSRTASGLS